MLVRGTTQNHTFVVPFAADIIQEVYLTYAQNDEVKLDFNDDDVTIIPSEIDENAAIVSITLSQEDTLTFDYYKAEEKNIVKIQLRILTVDEEAYASIIMKERVYEILHDGFIEDAKWG